MIAFLPIIPITFDRGLIECVECDPFSGKNKEEKTGRSVAVFWISAYFPLVDSEDIEVQLEYYYLMLRITGRILLALMKQGASFVQLNQLRSSTCRP